MNQTGFFVVGIAVCIAALALWKSTANFDQAQSGIDNLGAEMATMREQLQELRGMQGLMQELAGHKPRPPAAEKKAASGKQKLDDRVQAQDQANNNQWREIDQLNSQQTTQKRAIDQINFEMSSMKRRLDELKRRMDDLMRRR